MPTWENPVIDVIQRLNKVSDRMHTLIEFLTILPEEVNIIKFFCSNINFINRSESDLTLEHLEHFTGSFFSF